MHHAGGRPRRQQGRPRAGRRRGPGRDAPRRARCAAPLCVFAAVKHGDGVSRDHRFDFAATAARAGGGGGGGGCVKGADIRKKPHSAVQGRSCASPRRCAARWAEVSGRCGRARHRRRDDRFGREGAVGGVTRTPSSGATEKRRRRPRPSRTSRAPPAQEAPRAPSRARRPAAPRPGSRGSTAAGGGCRRDALIVEEGRRHSAERLPIRERLRRRRVRPYASRRAARRIVVPGGHRREDHADLAVRLCCRPLNRSALLLAANGSGGRGRRRGRRRGRGKRESAPAATQGPGKQPRPRQQHAGGGGGSSTLEVMTAV